MPSVCPSFALLMCSSFWGLARLSDPLGTPKSSQALISHPNPPSSVLLTRGFRQVRLATDTGSDKLVALKIMQKEWIWKNDMSTLVRREIDIMRGGMSRVRRAVILTNVRLCVGSHHATDCSVPPAEKHAIAAEILSCSAFRKVLEVCTLRYLYPPRVSRAASFLKLTIVAGRHLGGHPHLGGCPSISLPRCLGGYPLAGCRLVASAPGRAPSPLSPFRWPIKSIGGY